MLDTLLIRNGHSWFPYRGFDKRARRFTEHDIVVSVLHRTGLESLVMHTVSRHMCVQNPKKAQFWALFWQVIRRANMHAED